MEHKKKKIPKNFSIFFLLYKEKEIRLYNSVSRAEYSKSFLYDDDEIQGRPEMYFADEWRIISTISIERFEADLICKYFGFESGELKIFQTEKKKFKKYTNK